MYIAVRGRIRSFTTVTNETKINGQHVKEDKIIKYCYIPFYKSLANFLQLPEVQMDLDRRLPVHDPANICRRNK
ncbi:unnamed protein product [Didymodactylos carnosus]|uniref:Uncharacterized protein n=1 Tax=Didymodactylos carnosus TaxID=1234261 RepID=A0A815WEH0_9BILA|nr:unnamed protein product [Didymodactylos carnosus]CAF1542191.1 unnamed protein product [Didymodactylos carnosus]CAF4207881.1 unnamed protein product [Didymodactylos carnosus]CAF4402635.1 unnamed protein product [Didymodactylos carnosus]